MPREAARLGRVSVFMSKAGLELDAAASGCGGVWLRQTATAGGLAQHQVLLGYFLGASIMT